MHGESVLLREISLEDGKRSILQAHPNSVSGVLEASPVRAEEPTSLVPSSSADVKTSRSTGHTSGVNFKAKQSTKASLDSSAEKESTSQKLKSMTKVSVNMNDLCASPSEKLLWPEAKIISAYFRRAQMN